MTNNRLVILLVLLQVSLSSCGQGSRTILGEESARKGLEQSLTDKTQHNVVDNKRQIIPDSVTAVGVAEKILFKIYGQSNIENQRPYEIYRVKNYWSISGTLPKDALGGTFLIIMDSRDGRIIRITHGK